MDVSPGPVDPSVLYEQDKHVSTAVWDGQERGALRCHEHTSKLGEWRLTQKQIELVETAGFGYLRSIPAISLDNPLISALVERWRKETNTFHFTVGEMTVTLGDVALLLGLAIDGKPVIGTTHTACAAVCERLLGRAPESNYASGGMVKLSWLKEFFSQCCDDSPDEVVEQCTRAYLLYLVGSTIFSTTTGNKVPVMYLPLFENFQECGSYAWGAAALAFLYRALGNACVKSQSTVCGCLTLLQVEWIPSNYMDSMEIPEAIRETLILGRSKTMLICFDKAERHLPDRCLRQYGMFQSIPEDVLRWVRKSRGVDGGVDLSGKMEPELNEWDSRHLHIVEGADAIDETVYMEWYLRITRRVVGRPISLSTEFQRTIAGIREIAYLADSFSTEGLDVEQFESISRIRYIAQDCLRDQSAAALPIDTPPVEVVKRIRGKERVRRNGEKRQRKDEIVEYQEGIEDDPSHHFYAGAVEVVDPLHAISNDTEGVLLQHCDAASDMDVDAQYLSRLSGEDENTNLYHVVDDGKLMDTASEIKLKDSEVCDGTTTEAAYSEHDDQTEKNDMQIADAARMDCDSKHHSVTKMAGELTTDDLTPDASKEANDQERNAGAVSYASESQPPDASELASDDLHPCSDVKIEVNELKSPDATNGEEVKDLHVCDETETNGK
ncbi:Protein MAIN-LIKE 2 [Linum grandiflorum]